MEVRLNGNTYSLEWNQGVVLRKNGALAADYANGLWTWLNPKLTFCSNEMRELLPLCSQFEEKRKL